MKRFGIYRISYELMSQFLNLDDNHQVVDAFSSHIERKRGVIGVKVSGPLMPTTLENQEISWVPLDHLDIMKGKQE